MSFTQPSHIIVTFDEYNVPDKKSVGSEFNGANIAKEIWFAFTDETLTNYTVVVNAKRADGDLGYRLCSKKTVNGVDYDYFALDSWFTEKVGKVILAVKVYKSSDITVNEDGTYTLLEDEPLIVVGDLFHLVVNYAPNADSLVAPFDPSDMQVIMAAIGNKASKSEVPLIVTALPSDLDTLIDGVYKYDGWLFMLTDGTLYRIDDDTATFIGKIGESVKYVKSSEILAKGNVVQLASATGGFVKVKKAVPSEINVRPQLILGFSLQAFTANGWGLILMQGYLSGINTSSATADGDVVYFDSGSASNGLFTMIRPTPPNAIVILGTVSNDAVNGSIDVRISTMPMSDQVNHDVTPTNYSSASQTVKDNLKGIDTAIGVLNTFNDTTVPATYIPLSQKGAINGVATLGADGKVPDAQMPNITITDTNVVNSQALMLALTAQVGDVCVRTDLNKTYILKTAPATVLGNWQELLTPTDSVLSVAGKTGAVTLAKADVGLGNVDNTSDANKPVSTATQTALDAKAGKFYATNLVVNGHFTSAISPWSVVGGVTLSLDNGTLKAVADTSSSHVFNNVISSVTPVAGHIYYLIAKTTALSGSNIRYYISNRTSDGSTETANTTFSSVGLYSLTLKISSVYTTTPTLQVRFSMINPSTGSENFTTTGSEYVAVDNVALIDLTATFGAGSEPTQVEMDKYLAQKFTNSYFDGTVEYATLADITGNKASVIKATNLVIGGNFPSIGSWYSISATSSVASNTLTSLASAQDGRTVFALGTGIIGHKYYFKGSIKADSSSVILFGYAGSGTTKAHSGSNAYETLSVIETATTSQLYWQVRDGRASGWTNVYVQYALLIDLTATFGAGKEPTVAQMNADLAYYTNSWFDGTVPFVNCFTLNATKANRQQEDWITPTLTNSWVANKPVQYMKDGFGFVHIKGEIKSGTSVMFILPTGYRPSANIDVPVIANGVFGYISIATSGAISLTSGSNAWVAIHTISFKGEL